MIKSLFALDCFAMLSFSLSYPPSAHENAHHSVMENGKFLLTLSWLRKKSPGNFLNNTVESKGVLSDFKVFLLSFFFFFLRHAIHICYWNQWPQMPVVWKHMVGLHGMEVRYLAQAQALYHPCVCFIPGEVLHLKSMASFSPYGDTLS